MSEFEFRTCDIEDVTAECFNGTLKHFTIRVRKTDPEFGVGTPLFEFVRMDPKKVETAVLMYLHRHSKHLARKKPRGQHLWLAL